MLFSSSIIALSAFGVATACPYASLSKHMPKNHPIIPDLQRRLQGAEESLVGVDGNLVGSPSLDNGAFDGPNILEPILEDGGTIADVVAALSTSAGLGDMCMVRFQQLPPPSVGSYAFDQNAADRLQLQLYGDIMVDRFYQLSGADINDGGIIFSATTFGSGGIESMCEAGIEPERFCDTRLKNTTLRWPQAVTGFKLTSETVDAVKSVISTWRQTEDGHLPAMTWSFLGGEPGQGGSEVGIWGEGGGLFSKIVRCDDIPQKLMYYRYPDDTTPSGDFIDPETNVTISELMYQWWTAYGGYNENGEQQFGEAFKLTGECTGCAPAFDCFVQFCEFIDWEAESWEEPYDFCNPAAVCAPCFLPICSPQDEAATTCSFCANGVPEANADSVVDSEQGLTCEGLKAIAPTLNTENCQLAASAEAICCPADGPSAPSAEDVAEAPTSAPSQAPTSAPSAGIEAAAHHSSLTAAGIVSLLLFSFWALA